jgi:prevent-host-death family protein
VAETTVRELRNKGGAVLDRVLAGERITVTRDGTPVAELRPLPNPPLGAAALVERFRRLPAVDPTSFRRDLDAVIDQTI